MGSVDTNMKEAGTPETAFSLTLFMVRALV
jgi:hypothetical protein